jgi:hypothetical protein
LVARGVSVGVVMGICTLSMAALTPLAGAQASYAGWSGTPNASKRPVFRPAQRVEAVAPTSRWRPAQASTPRVNVPARRWVSGATDRMLQPPGLLSAPRRAAAVAPRPAARMEPLGSSFRPDPRFAAHAASGAAAEDAHGVFRPAANTRRPSYEETQRSLRAAVPPTVSGLGYGPPRAGYLPPGYGAYPRYW